MNPKRNQHQSKVQKPRTRSPKQPKNCVVPCKVKWKNCFNFNNCLFYPGIGTNNDVLINTLSVFTNAELQTLVECYREEIQRDLIPDIKSETSGHFMEVLLGMLTPTATYDSHLIRNSIHGIGTNEDLLIEVICTRTPEELTCAGVKYEKEFLKPMWKDIEGDVGGKFKTLIQTLQSRPSGVSSVNDEKVKKDVDALYKAGEGKLGTNETVFIELIAGQTRAHVERVALEYGIKYGNHLSKAIDKEMSGALKTSLMTLGMLDVLFIIVFLGV